MFFVPQWQCAAVTNPTIAQNRAVVYGFVPYTCPAVTIQVTVHRPLYREAFSCRKHENPQAVWLVAVSGLPCNCKATPRGTEEG